MKPCRQPGRGGAAAGITDHSFLAERASDWRGATGGVGRPRERMPRRRAGRRRSAGGEDGGEVAYQPPSPIKKGSMRRVTA